MYNHLKKKCEKKRRKVVRKAEREKKGKGREKAIKRAEKEDKNGLNVERSNQKRKWY